MLSSISLYEKVSSRCLNIPTFKNGLQSLEPNEAITCANRRLAKVRSEHGANQVVRPDTISDTSSNQPVIRRGRPVNPRKRQAENLENESGEFLNDLFLIKSVF